MQQRLCHAEPLLHAQRVAFELFPDAHLHPYQLRHLLHPAFRHAAGPGVNQQIVVAGKVTVHIRIFHNAADMPHGLFEIRFDIVAVHQNGAAVDGQQAENHFDGGGFPRAVGAEEPKDFPLLNGKGHVLHHRTGAEALAHVLQHQDIACAHRNPSPLVSVLLLIPLMR